MEVVTKEATFSADVLVYVYETRGWVSVADKQRCTLSAKKWSSTSEGGVTHITAHTKDRRVVIDEPTFPPKGEFRVTRDTTFYQLTVAAVAGKAGPQVFGFKFQSADEGETFYDNLQRFNSQGVPDGGVRSQNEPAPPSRVQPRTTGKIAVSLPTTAVHAQSRPGIYSTEPICGSDVTPPSFWRTQGMQSGYHGREDRFQRSSNSSGSDGQVAVNNSLSHLTQAGAPSSPIVTRSQSYIDPSTGAITKASKQAMENCKLLERAINEGDFNTAVDTVRELIGARIDVTVRPQDTSASAIEAAIRHQGYSNQHTSAASQATYTRSEPAANRSRPSGVTGGYGQGHLVNNIGQLALEIQQLEVSNQGIDHSSGPGAAYEQQRLLQEQRDKELARAHYEEQQLLKQEHQARHERIRLQQEQMKHHQEQQLQHARRKQEAEAAAAAAATAAAAAAATAAAAAAAIAAKKKKEEEALVGWACPHCTLVNPPIRPGCEACSSARPDSYIAPDDYQPTEKEKDILRKVSASERQYNEALKAEREKNFKTYQEADDASLVRNAVEFECPVCFCDTGIGEGVTLRECLHTVCRGCLQEHIKLSEEADVLCPCQFDDANCEASITEREIRELLGDDIQRWWGRGMRTAEQQANDSFHCKTPDCGGWCYYEDDVDVFACPTCNQENCLMCKAIHKPMNCKEYQEDLQRKAANDEAARATQQMLQNLVRTNQAMHCPQCDVIVQKASGCDWMRCLMCKTEICWATKGRRWGPKGAGDTTGGCQCRVNGRKCAPHCGNCH